MAEAWGWRQPRCEERRRRRTASTAMAEAQGRRQPRPPPRLTMVEIVRDFPVVEIPVATSTRRQRESSAGARSRGSAAGTTAPRRGDDDDDAASLGRPDPEAQPVPDDDMLSEVAAQIRRDIDLHHELASASTTMSSTSASSTIQCSDSNPMTATAPQQFDAATTVGSDLVRHLASQVFLFKNNNFWCPSF
jgi:hypothetical protein